MQTFFAVTIVTGGIKWVNTVNTNYQNKQVNECKLMSAS